MIVVADASAVASFLLPDEAGPFADFARRTCLARLIHVPPHWTVEVANIIWKAGRRKRVHRGDMDRIVAGAEAIATTVVIGPETSIRTLNVTATRLGLTAYDTSYLLLAGSLGAPLLTADDALARAAAQAGVEILAS